MNIPSTSVSFFKFGFFNFNVRYSGTTAAANTAIALKK